MNTAQEIRAQDEAHYELAQRDREIILSQLRRYTVDLVGGLENSFIFAIYDRLAQRFAPPTTAYSGFIIIRELAAMIKRNPNLPIATNPDDFSLVCIGRYNELTGVISGRDEDDPISGRIGTIRDLLEVVKPADVTDFLRSALSHAEEPASSSN